MTHPLARTIPLLAALSLLLLGAPVASAAVLDGSGDDPLGDAVNVDRAAYPIDSRDIAQLRSSFDGAAGTWTVTVRFYAPPQTADIAQIHATLWEQRDGTCPVANTAAQIGALNGGVSPSSTHEYWTIMTPGEVAQGGSDEGKRTSADGLEVTLSVTTGKLAARAGYCVDATVSHNGVIDRIDRPLVLAAPGSTPPPAVTDRDGDGVPDASDSCPDLGGPAPSGCPVTTPADPPPLVLALLGPPRASASRTGALTVRLAAVPRAASGRATLEIRAGRRWRRLARTTFTTTAGARPGLKLRLGAADRRLLARKRRLATRLTVTAAPAGGSAVTKRFTLTLSAPRR